MHNRRFVVVAAVAALGMLATCAGLVQLRSSASWDAMERSVAELTAERTVVGRRQPLAGAALDEPAAQHYDAAITLEAALSDAARAELKAAIGAGEDAGHASAAARERWQPIVAAVRRGAHAIDTGRLVTAGLDPFTGAPDMLACRNIAFAAVLEARMLRNLGHGSEAVQWTLDAATFGNDLARRGTLIQQIIGDAITGIATFDAWPATALARLDHDGLELLAQGLSRLDDRLPTTVTFDEDLLLLARQFEVPGGGAELGGHLTAWRYGFSTRWMLADAFHQVRAWTERIGRPSASWPERIDRLEREAHTMSLSLNPVVGMICPLLTGAERGRRETQARVRLLRIAIELRCGRQPPPLDDPLGDGPLLVEAVDGGHRIRSVGERAGKPIELVIPAAEPRERAPK